LLSAYRVELARNESEPELKHRLAEATRDGEERRRQARIILRLLAATYVALLVLAFGLAVWGTAEQQKWALGALMTILGSILGYLVGRKT
jgi:fatty acid desaturase